MHAERHEDLGITAGGEEVLQERGPPQSA